MSRLFSNKDRPYDMGVLPTNAYPVAPVDIPAGTCTVEAAITEGHHKLALVHLGAAGGSWCLASDEGAYLRGTDRAPAPLMHWAAGVHADFLARVHAQEPAVFEFGYAVSGSFVQGGARGEAFAPVLTFSEPFDQRRLAASPLWAAIETPLRNTFALYVNGRRREVRRVPASEESDIEDPFLRYAAAPSPVHEPRPRLIGKEPLDSDAQIVTLPASGGRRFGARVDGALRDGLVRSTVAFPQLPSSRFTFTADAEGRRAPSGLAYAWAAVAFCYLTQLSRYIDARKLGVASARLVQRGPLGGPVDTHLFLNGAAEEGAMQELLAMAAGTCYLHATLNAALETKLA